MRLLQCDDKGRYTLTSDLPEKQVPPYAILSHTWGNGEVIFEDVSNGDIKWKSKDGFQKIRFCGDQAKRDGLQYFWIDTCCIDKRDSVELSTAINSMFRWYQQAEKCYVYLPDVFDHGTGWETAFRHSRWFSRGWTLQELIAPKVVEFYANNGDFLGSKALLNPELCRITGIPTSALSGSPLSNFSIPEREAWVQKRETKYEEDMAYSLFGIFNVKLPLIYGEGKHHAFQRLREEVQKRTKGTRYADFSVPFNLLNVPEIHNFVARKRELIELRKALGEDGNRHVAVLHGLGGIGKTQLAVAYAKHYKSHYTAVFWLNIKDETSIAQSFIEIARKILQTHPTAGRLSSVDLQGNQNEIVEAVKAWLDLDGNARWLLIFDNYDNPKLATRTSSLSVDIRHFMPKTDQGSIIVTTRSSEVNLGRLIRVGKLDSEEDSLEMLSATSARADLGQDPYARKLVVELDGLPLAIATAGAYLRHIPISLKDYIRHYKDSWARLHASTPSLGSYADRTLLSTWQLSYKVLQERHELAAKLLQWWAYFDNQDMWHELLVIPYNPSNDVSRLSPAWVLKLQSDELCFNHTIGTLYDYGFIEFNAPDPEGVESTGYSMHNCVHLWTTHVLNKNWNTELSRLAVNCIAGHIPMTYFEKSWLLRKRMLLHATRLRWMVDHNKCPDNWEFASHKLGKLYEDQGNLQEAEAMYLRVLGGLENALRPNSKHTFYILALQSYDSLAGIYHKQGRLEKAEVMCLKALRGLEKVWGPDQMRTINCVHTLASIYFSQSKLREAEEMYLRALRRKEKAFGFEHELTLITINGLGRLYLEQGEIQGAEEMFSRALVGYEKALGPEHPLTLATVENFAGLYRSRGTTSLAEKMYLRTLQGYEKTCGLDHVSTLGTANNLGKLYFSQGKLEEAEELYLRALRGYEKTMSVDHVNIYKPALATMENLRSLYTVTGRPIEAQKMHTRASNGLERLCIHDQIDLQDLRNTLSVSQSQELPRLPVNSSSIAGSSSSKENSDGQQGHQNISKIRKSIIRVTTAMRRM